MLLLLISVESIPKPKFNPKSGILRAVSTLVLGLHRQWCQEVLQNQVLVTGFQHNAGKDLRFYLYGIRFLVLGFYTRMILVTGINIGT